MNDNYIKVIVTNEKGTGIEFRLNRDEFVLFINGGTFKAMLDDLLKVTFEK